MSKSFENSNFTASPGIDKQRMLEAVECHWIEKAEVVIVVGNPGVGKGHCATALRAVAVKPGMPFFQYVSQNDARQRTGNNRLGAP